MTVVSLRKRRIRKARNAVRVHKLYRLEGELALDLVLRVVEKLQRDLDTAVAELRSACGRKAA
jgi:hypothetical protein